MKKQIKLLNNTNRNNMMLLSIGIAIFIIMCIVEPRRFLRVAETTGEKKRKKRRI